MNPRFSLSAKNHVRLDVVHRMDEGGARLSITSAVHNIFGMENARATYDGLRNWEPDERPFVLTRAAYPALNAIGCDLDGDHSANLESPFA